MRGFTLTNPSGQAACGFLPQLIVLRVWGDVLGTPTRVGTAPLSAASTLSLAWSDFPVLNFVCSRTEYSSVHGDDRGLKPQRQSEYVLFPGRAEPDDTTAQEYALVEGKGTHRRGIEKLLTTSSRNP